MYLYPQNKLNNGDAWGAKKDDKPGCLIQAESSFHVATLRHSQTIKYYRGSKFNAYWQQNKLPVLFHCTDGQK
jgi:hypothetical protein